MTDFDPIPLTERTQEQQDLLMALTDADRAALEAENPYWLPFLFAPIDPMDALTPARFRRRVARMRLRIWLQQRADPDGYAREQAELDAERQEWEQGLYGELPEQKICPGGTTKAIATPAAIVPEVLESDEEEELRSRRGRSGSSSVGVPTSLARRSPFFPMQRNALRSRGYVKDMLISFGPWGSMSFTGELLSTFDEDVLLAFLVVLRKLPVHTQTDSEERITYCGPIYPIAQVLGYKTPGKREYARIIESLKRMMTVIIEQSVSNGSFQCIELNHILERARWDEKAKKLTVTVTPVLYKALVAGRGAQISLIDVQKRFALSSEIAKAIQRFMASHRGTLRCNFAKLAVAINMDTTQPAKTQRRLLKKAVEELIQHGILAKGSGVVDRDTIVLIKVDKRRKKAGKASSVSSHPD